MNDIIATTQLLGSLQGFILGLVIISRKKNRLADRVFSIQVLLISVAMLARFFIFNHLYFIALPLSFIVIPGMLLFGPLLYLYTRIVTGNLEKIPRHFYFHYIPSAIMFVMHSAMVVSGKHGGFPRERPDFIPLPVLIVMVFVLFSTMCYLSCSWHLLILHRRRSQGELSPFIKNSISWMRVLLGLMTVIFILVNVLLWMNMNAVNSPDLPLVIPLLMVVFIFISTFYALHRPELFWGSRFVDDGVRPAIPVLSAVKNEKKYSKHNLDETTGRRYAGMIIDCMEKEKPYLDENLTLGDLADEVGIPNHHLSIVMNLYLGQSFYQFINRYRTEEVKKKLADTSYGDKNILSIAYECGFNSKAAFNKLFKQSTGLTPSGYRKNIPA